MTQVLVICSVESCKREIRPLKGEAYAAVKRGGRYRPACMDCWRRLWKRDAA